MNDPLEWIKEELNQIRGMLILGPPGTLGRISAMYDINRLDLK